MRVLLRLLSHVYGASTALRNWLFDSKFIKSYKASVPVISIGNLVAGGSGKTPLVIEIVAMLQELGLRPVVISRGYGGSMTGPIVVNRQHTTREVGDEPLLLATHYNIPVVVARKRTEGARFVQENDLGSVIVLDDGFQHRYLCRDIDILVIDISTQERVDQFLKGELLPLGRFRENRDKAIRRADAYVISSRTVSMGVEELEARKQQILQYLLPQRPLVVMTLDAHKPSILTRVVAVCAIANPQGFLNSLKTCGYEVVQEYTFNDHHQFLEKEIQSIKASHPDIPIICTRKDWIKIREVTKEPILVFDVEGVISSKQLIVDEFKKLPI